MSLAVAFTVKHQHTYFSLYARGIILEVREKESGGELCPTHIHTHTPQTPKNKGQIRRTRLFFFNWRRVSKLGGETEGREKKIEREGGEVCALVCLCVSYGALKKRNKTVKRSDL